MKLWVKILLSLLATAAILFGGFIAMIIAAFGSGGNFYAAIAAATAVVIWLFAITQIWGLLKRKIRLFSFCAAVGLIIISIAVFEINKVYVNSIDEVSEQGVDLTLYEPFRENSKAVSLDGQSSLKISDDLPKLDGATALYPLYSAFARAVYPEYDYPAQLSKRTAYPEPDYPVTLYKEENQVVCTTTEGAYRRLVTGDADIIFVAGPSREQLQMAKDNGVELKLTPIGREAFVFFVNAKNSVNNLNVTDIRKIYSGEAKNWSEFGGKNAEIKAFQRPENSGSQTALVNLMDSVPLMNPPAKDIVDPMGGIISRVSDYKNYNSAIGYSFLFFATEMVNDNKIKLLSLNGIAPTRENVANKAYPYASEFYAVTAGTKNPNSEKLIEWILSEQGQYLVNKTGYTPLNGGDKRVGYKKITPREAQEKMSGEVIILDVRTREEFDEGHIKNAVLLPDYEITDRAEVVLPDKDKTILVYCRSGARSREASRELIEMGYSKVYDFGGIINWTGEIEK